MSRLHDKTFMDILLLMHIFKLSYLKKETWVDRGGGEYIFAFIFA